MATYKENHGTNIQTVTSDPDNPVNGQVWYNSTTQTIKGFTSNPAGTWSSTANLNTARYQLGGAGKLSTAALVFGGSPPPAPTAKAITEQWNGTSWTEVADLNERKALSAGVGTYTSAIAAGGDQYTGTAETWNGSSWTNITDEPSGSNGYGSAGADSEDAVYFGGSPPTNVTRYWNGSSWTVLSAMNENKSNLTGAGATYTSVLAIGGTTGGTNRNANVEEYNGSSWTEIANLNTGRTGLTGSGEVTSALAYAGTTASSPATGATESWNGSAWTETGDLNTARAYGMTGGGAGPDNESALMAGGSPETAASEEFVSPTTSTVTFTVS